MNPQEADACLTRIYALLYWLGARANLCGFRYLSYAMLLVLESPERLERPTERIYPEVARRYHTDVEEAFRNIRRVIFLIWKGNRRRLQELAGTTLDASPSPKRFLAFACRYLEKQGNKPSRRP